MWDFISHVSGIQFIWVCQNLEEALESLTNNMDFKDYKSLPVILIWGVWLTTDKAIFENRHISPSVYAIKGLAILSHFP